MMTSKTEHTIHTHTVPYDTACQRICDYLAGVFPGMDTKSAAKKCLKRGEILHNSSKATSANFINTGDQIQWQKPIKKPRKTFHISIDVIFEDDDLAVINKPAGIVVSGNQFRTIENALSGCLKASSSEDALIIPQPVHRLDSLTSGLLIIAKTSSAHLHLSRQFQTKTIKKVYNALVIGMPPTEYTITNPIENREAVTHIQTLKSWHSNKNGCLTLLEVTPETGRTHQIRIHLQQLGFPILGDALYGTEGFILKHRGLFLCAVALEFTHPKTGEPVKVKIAPPPKFSRFPENEEKRYLRK